MVRIEDSFCSRVSSGLGRSSKRVVALTSARTFERKSLNRVGCRKDSLVGDIVLKSTHHRRDSNQMITRSRSSRASMRENTMKSTSGQEVDVGEGEDSMRSIPRAYSSQKVFQSVRVKAKQLTKSLNRSSSLFARPELVAIALVYLVQGLLRLSSLAVFTLFKDELHMSPATVGFLTGITMFPWLIKPLYGFMSDSVPLWGYKRRSYLIACGGLGALSWITVSTNVISVPVILTALTCGSLSTACADVVADSIVVELSRGRPQSTAGSLQSLCWASVSAGSVMSAYFSGSLVENYGPRPVFLITSCFPLLVALAATSIPEKKLDTSGISLGQKMSSLAPAMKQQAIALWGAISQKSIMYPAIFVFLWQATPTADTAMLYFETNKLGFSTEFLGRIKLLASIASLLGVGVYNTWLKDVELRKIFTWTAVIGTGLGMTQLMLITGVNEKLGMSNELFALSDSALLTVLGQVSFMPVLVLAARLCPEGVEATLFATLMSLLNGGSFLGSALGAGLTGMFGVTSENFDNLAPLIALCTLLTLAPLPFLRLLPESINKDQDHHENKEHTLKHDLDE
jgi:folate/biopterin transporter